MPEEFVPITTQEDFQARIDAILKHRLDRAEKSFKEKYAEDFKKSKAYDEAAEQNKSELQKALDRATEAESRATQLETEVQIRQWADEVSSETGVPAQILRGKTKEEMEAHAEACRSYAQGLVPKAPTVSSEGRRPQKIQASTNADLFAEILNDTF